MVITQYSYHVVVTDGAAGGSGLFLPPANSANAESLPNA